MIEPVGATRGPRNTASKKMHERERGGKVAGGDIGKTHRFGRRELEVEAAGRGLTVGRGS